MNNKLAVGLALAAATSAGALATPAVAATTTCSYLFCFQAGSTSGTVWTDVGPLQTTVTVQSPVWAIVPS